MVEVCRVTVLVKHFHFLLKTVRQIRVTVLSRGTSFTNQVADEAQSELGAGYRFSFHK